MLAPVQQAARLEFLRTFLFIFVFVGVCVSDAFIGDVAFRWLGLVGSAALCVVGRT